MRRITTLIISVMILSIGMNLNAQKKYSNKKIKSLKNTAINLVEEDKKKTQIMVDKVFSFSELGFQEFETSNYLTSILESNDFIIEKGASNVPTAWFATWSNGDGGPTIALGSDIDGIPKASQYPGVAYHKPIIEGAPGHGEGHNSGLPVVITATLSVQKIMKDNNIEGTLVLWPGVAEEQIGTKAWYVRDGYFDNIDMCIFTHVSSNLGVSWGLATGTGLISVEYTFDGETAHSAGAPWRGRSALDAAELMNIAWNYKREHLHPLKRSHSIFTDAGDQPNVVPSKASIWFYFRDIKYEGIMDMYDTANKMAEGAALMTNTSFTSRILGTAWPRHFNKVIAEEMYENINNIGLPDWSENDQKLAIAVQKEVNSSNTSGLATKINKIGSPLPIFISGGSDDIGDISWKVPTVTLRFPSNIPGLQGHHWSNSIAMATPIAHKGANAGAKVLAMTILDFLLKPDKLTQAKNYFENVQKEETEYRPMISENDPPATFLNKDIMEQYKSRLKEFYFDETKYETYLEQLGIDYPVIKKD